MGALCAFCVAFLSIPAAAESACEDFGEAALHSELQSAELTESSGLTFSRRDPDLLWTHNDSGDGAFLYGFSVDGSSRGKLHLRGVEATDWEDLSYGPCGDDLCLYIGDIGDNRSQRNNVTLWRFPEPQAPGAGEKLSVGAQRLDVVYPEGPRDAEGLAVDPLSGDILLVQKTVDRLFSVYRIPSTMWGETQGWAMAEILTGVALPGGTEALMVTQADIDPSGSELFLGTYGAGFRLDLIRQDGLITDLGSPRKAPIYGQGQCEAMSYSHSGLDLYFTCEASPTPLARSACTQRRSNSIPDRSSTDPSQKGRNDLGCHCESTSTPASLWAFLLLLLHRRRDKPTRTRLVHGGSLP